MFVVCCGCRKISKRGLFHIEGGSFLKQPIYNTALYLRLSRDDKTYGDSVSIETQRAILQQYAQDNGLHVVDVPFPVSWTVKMKKKQKETQDILSYHSQAAGCSDKARAKASGGRQPIEECGRTGL